MIWWDGMHSVAEMGDKNWRLGVYRRSRLKNYIGILPSVVEWIWLMSALLQASLSARGYRSMSQVSRVFWSLPKFEGIQTFIDLEMYLKLTLVQFE